MSRRGATAALYLTMLAAAPAMAGPFGPNYSAYPMTSSVFRAWISGVTSFTHPTNSGGLCRDDFAYIVSPQAALQGQPMDPGEAGTHHVSLGAGGSVVVRFDEGIYDGPGPDFAVFENGILDDAREDTNDYLFAELAYVEVASRTNAWARFPCQFLGTDWVFNATTPEFGFASMDVTLVDGLAGKHRPEYGTPFDLALLRGHSNVVNGSVDLGAIRYIRLVDIVGNGTMLDSSNRPIFDPYYSSFSGYPNPSAPSVIDGFDLRAVGLINSGGLTAQSGGGMRFFAASNSVWQVECAASPAGPWSNAVPAVTGTDTNVTIGMTGAARQFYRLQRRPAP